MRPCDEGMGPCDDGMGPCDDGVGPCDDGTGKPCFCLFHRSGRICFVNRMLPAKRKIGTFQAVIS